MRAPALATTALLACLALVGCESDPVGPVDPDDTATPSQPPTTPTPTGPTPPVLPEAAKANTPEGAVQFVVHYIELLNYAANTGDVDPLRAASQTCEGCEKYAELYAEIYGAGGYLEDPGWKPIAPFGQREGGVVTVVTEVEAPAVTTVRSAGATPEVGTDAKYSLRFQVKRGSGSWLIVLLEGSST